MPISHHPTHTRKPSSPWPLWITIPYILLLFVFLLMLVQSMVRHHFFFDGGELSGHYAATLIAPVPQNP